jgi:hypothetical protein
MSQAAGGDSAATDPISVRARFERFPATVKGAFILRGEDPNPHQVVLRAANVVGIGLGTSHRMPVAVLTLDVAPHRDVFVPFEMPVGELDPGWYTMTCDLDVDGTPRTYDGGRRFSAPWPRASVRRGLVKVGRSVTVDDVRVSIEQLECTGDCVKLHLVVVPPRPVTAKLAANGDRLEVLDTEQDETTGRMKVTAYPVLRAHSTLRLQIRAKPRGAEAEVDVQLP